MNRGVYGKYILEKADGSPIDPEATYFVLRLDTDPAARAAMLTYADAVMGTNPELAQDIARCINQLEQPDCGCRTAECEHTPWSDDVWHHGG